jgi:Protein of unknown function (DUF3014)
MSNDLDDYEIQPPRKHGQEPALVFRERSWRPAVLAVVLLALAGAGAFFLTRPRARKVEAPAPPIAPLPAVEVPPRPGASTPLLPVPPLDESDAFVRQIAAGLSSHPEVARWLARTALVRTLTAVVANIASGETPRRHLELLTPKQRFRAAQGGTRIVADPASFRGYDLFGDAFASVDAQAATAAYRATEPLFDAAYRELGNPEGFRPALDTAIRALLAVRVPPAEAELVPYAGGFRWANPELEALTPAQKQLLRTGPRNVRLVQAKLRELQAALVTADAR